MEEDMLKQIRKLAEKNNYEELILNFKREKPVVIKGIKGSFIPEVLLYKKGEIKALVSFVKSLEKIEEIYKLTLLIDYISKKSLSLYILYDPRKISDKEILKKLEEKKVKLPENVYLVKLL
ncbi:MAG: hypothetical protein QXU11_10720 [Thermoproteota archaeon]